MTLQADLNTVTAKLNTDADQITALGVGSGSVGTSGATANFTLPSGYIVTLDANGISLVKNQGAVVAQGSVKMVDGSWFYKAFQNVNYAATISAKLALITANGAIVTHDYTGAVTAHAVYTYSIVGNAITVSVVVTNKGATDIPIPAFRSPNFLFDSLANATASSNQLGYDSSHTQSQGVKLSYPCANVPYAATYIKTLAGGGKPLNFCTWSGNNPFDQFMTIRDGTYQVAGNNLDNFFFKTIPVGGSQTFKFSYLFSDSIDPHVLLQGYKDYLRTQLPIQYDPDARPWAYFASLGTNYIRTDNPYGYNDSGLGLFRRFDKLTGCQDYVSKLLGPMQDVNYQGVMFWQPQGINPRGVQYRPDFNVWPPESLANVPTLFNGFINGGKRVGLLSRPSIAISSATWATDEGIRVTDYIDTWNDFSLRIKWATDRGVTAFYLDSFVSDGPDHNILKLIRAQLGLASQLYTENPTVLSAALSGVYSEFSYTNSAYAFTKTFDTIRFIYPESIYFMKFVGNLPPGGYPTLYPYMFQNKLTPIIEDYRVQNNAAGSENQILKPLVTQYINAQNHWI